MGSVPHNRIISFGDVPESVGYRAGSAHAQVPGDPGQSHGSLCAEATRDFHLFGIAFTAALQLIHVPPILMSQQTNYDEARMFGAPAKAK